MRLPRTEAEVFRILLWVVAVVIVLLIAGIVIRTVS
jgi:hypothetical protein